MPAPRPLTGPREQGSEQRFLSFVLLSIAVFLFYQSFMAEPPPRPPAVAENAEGEGEEAGDVEDAEAESSKAADAAEPDIAEQPEAQRQLLTLGSAALGSDYRMLVTLDNRGAGVRRIEMSAEAFRDLDDRGGYLGHLGLQDVADGRQRVRVVGPGTPAEAAGLQVGDEIVDAEQTLAALAGSKPGDTLPIQVVRRGEEQSLSATLSKRPQAVIRPESENVRQHNPDYADASTDIDSFLLSISELNGEDAGDNTAIKAANARLTSETWEVAESTEHSVTFRKRIAELGLEFDKRFELARVDPSGGEPAYHLTYNVSVTNLLPREQSVAYDLHGPNGLPIEGWWYAMRFGRKESGAGAWGSVGLRDVVFRSRESTSVLQARCTTIVDGEAAPMGEGASHAFVGVDAQYFSVVLIPEKESFDEKVLALVTPRLATPQLPEDGTMVTYNNTTFTATRLPLSLAAAGGEGASHADAFTVFAGPKRPELLKRYVAAGDANFNLEKLLYYGWFEPVAKGMLWLLHLFGGVVGNYGLAIVMLTVVVRGTLFPLSRKQAVSMVKMQALKPEMDKIQERYKNDAEKKARAIQELYSKNGVSPLSGCLPAFVQLPIFIGLYRALAVDIELRQAPLISESVRFCSNLAAPDMLLDWSWLWPASFNNGIGFGFFPGLGPYFNALPMFTVALFLIQQKMFMPPPANEQAELQQKMMMYIMPIFGLLFFKVPSGLCLYFIASSVWGIAERKLVPKPEAPEVQGFSKPIAKKPPATQSAALAKQAAKRAAGGKKKKKRK